MSDVCARLGEWLATLDLDTGGRVVLFEYGTAPLPSELVDLCRVHKRELTAWLTWERDAGVLWRAVQGRTPPTGARADLAADPQYRRLEAVAEAAHRAHDRAALVRALEVLEAYATKPDEECG